MTAAGPLFDGRAGLAMHLGVMQARDDIAETGKRLAAEAFSGSIRENHGVFLGSIQTIMSSRTFTKQSGHTTYSMTVEAPPGDAVVTTDMATYGPWLEGTGSRNETTRFKGYAGFRRASDELDRMAGEIARASLEPFIREANL